MAEHAAVIRITRYRPVPDKRDELVSRLEQGAEQIRQIQGCFGVQICSVRETPDEVVSISRWANQSALDEFLRSSEPQRGALNEFAGGPPQVDHLTPI